MTEPEQIASQSPPLRHSNLPDWMKVIGGFSIVFGAWSAFSLFIYCVTAPGILKGEGGIYFWTSVGQCVVSIVLFLGGLKLWQGWRRARLLILAYAFTSIGLTFFMLVTLSDFFYEIFLCMCFFNHNLIGNDWFYLDTGYFLFMDILWRAFMLLVYPVFLVIWFTRKKIAREYAEAITEENLADVACEFDKTVYLTPAFFKIIGVISIVFGLKYLLTFLFIWFKWAVIYDCLNEYWSSLQGGAILIYILCITLLLGGTLLVCRRRIAWWFLIVFSVAVLLVSCSYLVFYIVEKASSLSVSEISNNGNSHSIFHIPPIVSLMKHQGQNILASMIFPIAFSIFLIVWLTRRTVRKKFIGLSFSRAFF